MPVGGNLTETAPSYPTVSVIVVNLNGGQVIRRCLDHLFSQTYPNVDIIVVDNNSSDESLEILESYLGKGNLSIVRSPYNRGCPGGRNLGVQYAQGEFVAFIDNDGYAHPKWLETAIQAFSRGSSIGAVASVVFFNRNQAVLNGAGGTVNWQGYGGDCNYHEPFEFAQLPDEVLYPMGCGMIVRRTALIETGPWDEAVLNYYDDTELGFRLWRSGYKVVVAPQAWVYHEFNFSSQFMPSRSYLMEQGRIRTALKYYPARHLARWLFHEPWHIASQGPYALIHIQAWVWNLLKLLSALKWRRKFRSKFDAFERLVSPSWGWFRFTTPVGALYQPDLDRLGRSLSMDENANAQLNYGWYPPEKDRTYHFRWTGARASLIFRLSRPVTSLSMVLKTRATQRIQLDIRHPGERQSIWETRLTDVPDRLQWRQYVLACALEAGDYELLLSCDRTFTLRQFRVGVAIARVEFS